MVLSEVCEIITLPPFDQTANEAEKEFQEVKIAPKISHQLVDLVSDIADLYQDHNPFHCFEHASHVVMSVMKLLGRIVAPKDLAEKANHEAGRIAMTLHDHTYGITSDPLTQFACLFVALVHDIDHPGVPNAQLAKENKAMAAIYEGRSIAEQNSFHLAMDLLMEDRFSLLRETLFATDDDWARFRQ